MIINRSAVNADIPVIAILTPVQVAPKSGGDISSFEVVLYFVAVGIKHCDRSVAITFAHNAPRTGLAVAVITHGTTERGSCSKVFTVVGITRRGTAGVRTLV